jgi:hypothetical protein
MQRALLNKIGLIVTVLLVGMPLPEAFGEDWVLFAISMDGKIEEFYDRVSLAYPSPDIVGLTTKTVKYDIGEGGVRKKGLKGSQNGKEGLHVGAYTITRHRIECRSRSDTLLSSADYDQDGRLVHHSEVPCVIPPNPHRRPPLDLYPESVSENLIRIICPTISGEGQR